MGARRRKLNQQAAAGFDAPADYLDTDTEQAIKTAAKPDSAWYSALGLVVLSILGIWAILYVFYKSLSV